jgi:hypothetical protein
LDLAGPIGVNISRGGRSGSDRIAAVMELPKKIVLDLVLEDRGSLKRSRYPIQEDTLVPSKAEDHRSSSCTFFLLLRLCRKLTKKRTAAALLGMPASTLESKIRSSKINKFHQE